MLKPFIFGHWHAWQGASDVMLSDETAKNLWEFRTTDDCINRLFVAGFKPAARALHSHCKGAA